MRGTCVGLRRAMAMALTWALALAMPAAGEPVKVIERDVTYPVAAATRAPRPNWSPTSAAKLEGKDTYTTRAVILENEHLRVTVLPELGGRLVSAEFRRDGKWIDMFWRNDRLENQVSWSMGGGRWSFPFWEHGRHFDETAGYVVVRRPDGSVKLAMDMRFDSFMTRRETLRYGRATNLRLVQEVELSPGEAALGWTARVDNPLPVPHGFKLWFLLRQPATAGTRIILPVAAVTGHGAPAFQPWDLQQTVDTLQTSVFAIGRTQDFAGWWLPDRQVNVLAVSNHAIAPGAKQVLYKAGDRGYIEMWGGNHEVFEECGRMLPPFGSYGITLRICAAPDIGPAEYANEQVAIAARTAGGKPALGIAPVRALRQGKVTLSQGGQTVWQSGADLSADPLRPVTVPLPAEVRFDRITLTGASGEVLANTTWPVDVGQPDPQRLAAVQARIQATMPGGKGLYEEATDLVSETQGSLVRGAEGYARTLEQASDRRELLDAARRLMRVRKDAPEALAGLDKVLKAHPRDPQASLYKAMWLIEAGRAGEASPWLGAAMELPGGRYLAALQAMAKHQPAEAVKHLEAMLAMPVTAGFDGAEDPALGLLQPGAVMGMTQPRLLLALAQRKAGQADQADATLRMLMQQDPSLIECRLLLKDNAALATLTAANASGLDAARANLAALEAGKWAGIGRPAN